MNKILQIGTVLRERYKITNILSSNTGFGITYKVKDSNHPNQPTRILKQLKKPTAAKLNIENLPIPEQQQILNQYWQEYLRLFRIETQVLAKLGEEYKQIPTIYEYFDEQDEYFYVQEYIEGDSLKTEVKQGQTLSEQKTISLLIEILEVFEYIQTNPGYSVIHRDIKPENIIRKSTDNKLVVIDFGLAKEVTVPGTKIGSILGGTKGYIAPEILLGTVSFASDIYSIGMIGVFAVTGEDPTYTPTLAENWQPKANVSPEFAAVLNQMICESYKQRFQNATEALAALRTLNKKPVPPPPLPKIKLPIKLIAGFVLAVVVVIGITLIVRNPENQLIADGKEKAGQLTTSDDKEFGGGKNFDGYKFKSDKKQYLTVQIVSQEFSPIFTVRKLDDPNFMTVKDVANKDNNFTASIMVDKGEYELKIKSENAALGDYVIKAWVTDIK
ncbi:serine/threonine protein kinase [Sphaerospermopsis aphanizomenoides BCCUSP55]|uniref:serine/threonine-protein kinase n=1 Tax=Sphaerospermopsis aphanizomenoides TaxID=459663 RepID=UPI001905ED69|nr:serine/threonine-protein kinase [Sphaerospermopsis aphanizomenoides]MBK1987774.1 serine/threonine protein kinase [Sphaerospermopsis aphanizomenoides BCCUSP55]